MHMYQGKGRWGFTCRSASFDLASPELRVPDFEVRNVHESTTFTNQLHHYGAFLDFPTRKHAIALTLILVCFRSIRFKLSNRLRGVSEPNVWLYSSSWITTQELGLRAVFNETTHCVLLHSLSSFTLY